MCINFTDKFKTLSYFLGQSVIETMTVSKDTVIESMTGRHRNYDGLGCFSSLTVIESMTSLYIPYTTPKNLTCLITSKAGQYVGGPTLSAIFNSIRMKAIAGVHQSSSSIKPLIKEQIKKIKGIGHSLVIKMVPMAPFLFWGRTARSTVSSTHTAGF